jgi:hypothetical protein
MPSATKTFVFRVQGLPASQSDATLLKSLEATIVKQSGDLLGSTTRLSIVPSCRHNTDDRRREKVALMEVTGEWPTFLSALKDDPLETEEFEMDNEIIAFDYHFHGFTQLYEPSSESPVAECVSLDLSFSLTTLGSCTNPICAVSSQ